MHYNIFCRSITYFVIFIVFISVDPIIPEYPFWRAQKSLLKRPTHPSAASSCQKSRTTHTSTTASAFDRVCSLPCSAVQCTYFTMIVISFNTETVLRCSRCARHRDGEKRHLIATFPFLYLVRGAPCISLAQLNALSCPITGFSLALSLPFATPFRRFPDALRGPRRTTGDVNLTALSRRKSVYRGGGVTLEIFSFVYLLSFSLSFRVSRF